MYICIFVCVISNLEFSGKTRSSVTLIFYSFKAVLNIMIDSLIFFFDQIVKLVTEYQKLKKQQLYINNTKDGYNMIRKISNNNH